MALPSLSLAVFPRSLSLRKATMAVLRLLLRLLIRLRFSRPLFPRLARGSSLVSVLAFLALLFSSVGSGSSALLAADASWIANRNSGTWEQYQGHDLQVVVATYRPKNTTITNSLLLGVTTTTTPIRQYAQYASGAGFFYAQNSTDNTISFYCLYCPDLDTIITYGTPSGTGGARIKREIRESEWYRTRRAQEPAFESIIDVASIFSTIAQLLINWFVIAVGVAISIFTCVYGIKWARRLVPSKK